MTTFQALVDAFLSAIVHLLPISEAVLDQMNETLFHWSVPAHELSLLVVLMGSLAFLYFFRFDWLGMISALIKTVAKPLSLKALDRNLDQHTLLFLIFITAPHLILKRLVSPWIAEIDALNHPIMMAVFSLVLAFGFHFSHRWNKRIHGLNHLKLFDGVSIAALTLLSAHPAFPYLATLWIGFALNNYHTEAIFKYSMLALGVSLMSETIVLLSTTGLRLAFDQVGHLNSIAVLVISFTVFWLGLENLEKNLNEGTYKTFKWMSIVVALFFVIIYFIKG